MTHSERTNP